MLHIFRYYLLEKGLNVHGRTGLKMFWGYAAGLAFITVIIALMRSISVALLSLRWSESQFVTGLDYIGDIVLGLWFPVFLALLTIASIRRLHDSNFSSRNILWSFVPFGCLYVLYLLCLKGDEGPNDYGRKPSAKEYLNSHLSFTKQILQFRGNLNFFWRVFTQNIQQNKLSIRGRSSRLEYWSFCAFSSMIWASIILCCYSAAVLIGIVANSELVLFILAPIIISISVALFVLYLTNSIRRLQDVERPWYFVVCLFIPFVDLYIKRELMSLGTEGPNEYGEDPIPIGTRYDV